MIESSPAKIADVARTAPAVEITEFIVISSPVTSNCSTSATSFSMPAIVPLKGNERK